MSRVATIGFFDGVHKGHQFLFNRLSAFAEERGLQPLIVTFENHPRAVLQADYIPQLLTTPEERKALLSAYGEVLMLPFETVQPLTAEQFMDKLHTEYDVSVLLMGYDHCFGSDRLRHPHEYHCLGEKTGVEVITLPEFTEGEMHVSSSEIRLALERGNIAVANDLLGRPYSLCGEVVHGKGLGRSLGFPTANIQPDEAHKIIPKAGVYAVEVKGERLKVKGFCNVDPQGVIEVHMPDFKGDLYGQKLEITFLRFLREEKHFSSLQELQEQIKADVDNSLHQE